MKPLALIALTLLAGLATASTTVLIDAQSLGYSPIVATLASGDSVAWRSLDETHVTQDEAGIFGAEPCLIAVSQQEGTSDPIRLDIRDGALFSTIGNEEFPCGNAIDADTAFVLPYFCVLHPTMRGVLVVTA